MIIEKVGINMIIKIIIAHILARYYKKILYKIKDNDSLSDFVYDSNMILNDQTHDDHIYHFVDNIDISIQYSIPIVKALARKENEQYISFEKLKKY